MKTIITHIPGWTWVMHTTLAFDSKGTPHIVFYNLLGGDSGGMYYVTKKGPDWTFKRLKADISILIFILPQLQSVPSMIYP